MQRSYRKSVAERDTIRNIHIKESKETFQTLNLQRNDTITIVNNPDYFKSHLEFLKASEQIKLIFVEKVNDLRQESQNALLGYFFSILSFSLLSLLFFNR